MRHPREGAFGRPMGRREFLRRSAGTAFALSGTSALLAACLKRDEPVPGGTEGVTVESLIARPDRPVTLPIFDDNPPIADGLSPETNTTLKVYNWTDYIRPSLIPRFEEQYGVNVDVTTFHNVEIAVEKLAAGSVDFDIWFPTIEVIPKMVVAKLLQPLNLSYIPNLEANVWPQMADPFYDRGSHYSVPYTVYTTGIGYRRDEIPDEDVAALANPYEIFWDPTYRGKVGIYDSYRDAMEMVLLKNGITDVNTEDPNHIALVQEELFELIDAVNIKTTINGTYAKMPEGEFVLHQAWSGDLVFGLYQLPEGVTTDVLGYWWPPDGRGMIGSDLIVIPKSATNPVLAHHFLNFMLDERQSIYNFNWNLYQPPLNIIDPDDLVATGTVPAHLQSVVVQSQYFDTGYQQGGLPPAVDDMWLAAWSEFKAGV